VGVGACFRLFRFCFDVVAGLFGTFWLGVG
jgi:hypothetical protein